MAQECYRLATSGTQVMDILNMTDDLLEGGPEPGTVENLDG